MTVTTEKPLIDRITEYLAHEDVELPPFDRTALDIRQELSKDNPNMKQIVNLIVRDQAITSQILRVANSSFYKGMKEITTVRDALVRLGANEVANIVALVSQQGLFKSDDPQVKEYMQNLWVHSVACAVGAHWVAKQTGRQGVVEEAFFAGLLHDVGKLFLFKVIEEMKKKGELHAGISREFVDEVVHGMHSEQGYALLTRWNLPKSYCEVARHHHDEELDDENILLVAVRLSDKVCHKCGFGKDRDPGIDVVTSPEAAALDLSEVRLAELEIRIEDTMALVGALK